MIRNIIVEILNDIDEDIVAYDGVNLLDEGIIDSFTIMEIVSDIEDRLKISINPNDITEAHFKTIDAMVKFVESIKQ